MSAVFFADGDPKWSTAKRGRGGRRGGRGEGANILYYYIIVLKVQRTERVGRMCSMMCGENKRVVLRMYMRGPTVGNCTEQTGEVGNRTGFLKKEPNLPGLFFFLEGGGGWRRR